MRRSERGAALFAALMVTSLVSALAAALVFVTVTESRIGRTYQSAQAAGYAAAAGIERTVGELRTLADWAAVPASASLAAEFNDGTPNPTLADRTALDLARLTAARQAASDAFYPPDSNRPVWMLYAHAPLARITSFDLSVNPYVVVWIADDPGETDGDPTRDSNGILLVRAEAFGVRGSWRVVEATLAGSILRDPNGVAIGRTVSVVAWREAR
jgi:hypothetical protein